MMVDFDDPGTVELGVNPYYNEYLMGHDTTLPVNQTNWLPNATALTSVFFKVVKSGLTAAFGIINGTYDVIDSQMGIHADFDEVNDSEDVKILTSYEWGYQEMGINHYNPIFGMNAKEKYRHPPGSEHFNSFGLIFIVVLLSIPIFCGVGVTILQNYSVVRK